MPGGPPSSTSRASASRPAEFTPLALGLGVLIGLAMSVANVYLGLFAGMTVSASIPAAVISMGVLRGLLGRGTILENNIVQTVASAGESLAAGIIFTMPALVIAGVWADFSYWTVTVVAMAGGLLGVLFMIPLRRPMIVEDPDLIYPEGVACAKVLQAGEDSGGGGMRLVFGALGLGLLIKVLTDGIAVAAGALSAVARLGSTRLFLGVTVSPALVAVGWIVGFNIAALVFVGGAISWLVAAPVMERVLDPNGAMATAELASAVGKEVKFLGVGAMIVGGLWSILQIRHGIRSGLRQTFGGYRAAMHGAEPPPTERDLDRRWLLLLVLATTLIVLLLYQHLTHTFGEAVLSTVLMVVCSFFFVAVAAYIVGLVGSSNSPVSGMTIVSVLLTSGVIVLFGYSGEAAILATMGVAGVVCCATCTSGDVCQDLKTGHLVGATPYRQQWAEILGVLTASFVMAPVLQLLHHSYGIGTDAHLPAELQGHSLAAPQAALFASLMQGFFGTTELPWDLIGWGAGIGVVIIAVDQLVLLPRRSSFRLFVMPTAVGMYLPFGLSVAMLLGGLAAWAATRHLPPPARTDARERGVLLGSGLIAGEAIAGVLLAIPVALGVHFRDMLPVSDGFAQALGAVLLVGVVLLFLRSTRSSTPSSPA